MEAQLGEYQNSQSSEQKLSIKLERGIKWEPRVNLLCIFIKWPDNVIYAY